MNKAHCLNHVVRKLIEHSFNTSITGTHLLTAPALGCMVKCLRVKPYSPSASHWRVWLWYRVSGMSDSSINEGNITSSPSGSSSQ